MLLWPTRATDQPRVAVRAPYGAGLFQSDTPTSAVCTSKCPPWGGPCRLAASRTPPPPRGGVARAQPWKCPPPPVGPLPTMAWKKLEYVVLWHFVALLSLLGASTQCPLQGGPRVKTSSNASPGGAWSQTTMPLAPPQQRKSVCHFEINLPLSSLSGSTSERQISMVFYCYVILP
jgi:hypothetical protein